MPHDPLDNLPDIEELRDFIVENPQPVTKSEIASYFKIKGQERRRWLKFALKELQAADKITRTKGKGYRAPDGLPPVCVVEVIDIDTDGEVIATPTEYEGSGNPPRVLVISKSKHSIGLKDRVLIRTKRIEDGAYEGRIIHILGRDEKGIIVGVFSKDKDGGGIIAPTDRSIKYDFYVSPKDAKGAEDGHIVVGEIQSRRARYDKNRKTARIVEVLGHQDDPKMISLIAVVSLGIPYIFPDAVIEQAEKCTVPELGGRQDLRTTPLVTIDGADARDFDDAVYAAPDDSPDNEGGWHIIVAIADVSFYVTPGSALDHEAYRRGNSSYFPDRVIPMLPEALSNDVCSLRPHEPRASMAAHLWIDKDGKLLRYKFVRALIQSHARLIYEQVQEAKDGNPDETTEPVMAHIENLYSAYDVLKRAREERGALDLDLPERKAVIDFETGEISAIIPRERVAAHMLIEEFMVLANVAAASALEDKRAPCVYRVHDEPNREKLHATADFLSSFGIDLDKGARITPKRMNHMLAQAAEQDEAELVSTMVLRAQSQAIYSPENIGHFGLALQKYAHFTSPIRRYADLLVHRSLVNAYGMPGGGGLPDDTHAMLSQQSEHISDTERRSMMAERNSMDRYTSLFLADRIGNSFEGRISGVTRAGLFVRLSDSGADGLIPIRSLGDDYYVHHEDKHALIGRSKGQAYRLSAPVTVELVEADAMAGRMSFKLLEYHGDPLPEDMQPKTKGRGKGGRKGDDRKNFKKGRKGFGGKKGTKAPTKRKNTGKKKKKTTPKHKRKNK